MKKAAGVSPQFITTSLNVAESASCLLDASSLHQPLAGWFRPKSSPMHGSNGPEFIAAAPQDLEESLEHQVAATPEDR